MLSIEKPPSDPPENSLLKSVSDDEKIKSSSDKLVLPEVEADLLKSDLDDNHNNSNSPLPNFSIRDYVFSARNKDIAANWPFSEKSLQLCWKHGVTDLLPPFQPSDLVRNSSVVYDSLLDQENLSNTNRQPIRQSDEHRSVFSEGTECDRKLTSQTCSSGSDQGERELPSVVRKSHPEVDLEAPTLSEPLSKQVEAAVLPETRNTDITTQPPAKKCRLIVKISNLGGPSTKEDNMPNSFMVSETMASKVCPVCKTFSSSSNTTLNAHIDQCLSGESTLKWTADSKVIKHRIKPRKTKLIVDIYEKALPCTLEDLDRRNGTNWATNSTLPDQDNELCVEKRVQRVSTVALEETDQDGAVYIDSDGTKVRILSKFSEGLNSNAREDHGSRNPLKGDKGSKFLTAKKKKTLHKQKHQKFLKLLARGTSCAPKPCPPSFETRAGQERKLAMEQNGEKEAPLGKHSKAQEQIKYVDSGIIRQWVCSKRTGLTKKTTAFDEHQHSDHNLEDLQSEREQMADSYTKRNCLPESPDSSKSLFPSQSSKRMETSSNELFISSCGEQPHSRTRGEFSLSGSQGLGQGKRSMIRPKDKKLRKESTSVHDSCNGTPTHALSLDNKPVEMNATPRKTADAFIFSSKPSCSRQAFSSKASRFSSKWTKLSSEAFLPKYKSDHVKTKNAAPMRSQIRGTLNVGSGSKTKPSQSDDDQSLDSASNHIETQSESEEITEKMSRNRTEVLKIRKEKSAIKVSREEESAIGLESPPSEPPYYGQGVGEKLEFCSVNFGCDIEDRFDSEESESEDDLAHEEHNAIEPATKVAVGGSFMSSSNSLVQECNGLRSPPAQRESEGCAEVNQRHLCGSRCSICPYNPQMGDKQELFSVDEAGHVLSGEDTQMGTELDSKSEHDNYFSGVDPIPIPGPPGSFLPSPGHMGSEDLQGNSSLTTCRVQSTEDHHNLVDRDVSGSPISAISDISNPTLARSDSRSSEKFFVGRHAFQEEIRQDFSGAAPVSQEAMPGAEQLNFGQFSNNGTYPERDLVSSKVEQSCCCSRKEGPSHGVSLNFQDSQLLRRRTMASVPLPEKQTDDDSSRRLGNLNPKSEMFSPSSYLNTGPEKVVHQIPRKVSAEADIKFPISGDHDSPSPSTSNPILRLMGKNLMVVNKDEDASTQLGQQNSSLIHARAKLQSCTVSGVSPGTVGNKDYNSYHHMYPQGPVIFNPDRQTTFGHSDGSFSNNSTFKSNVDLKTPSHFYPPGVTFASMNAAFGSFQAFQEQHNYIGGINIKTEEHRPKNGLNNPLRYHSEKTAASSTPKRRIADSTPSPMREIIIIDDVPDHNEADSAVGTMLNEKCTRNQLPSSGISVPSAFELSSRFYPFYGTQLETAGPLYGGRQILQGRSKPLMPKPEGANASPLKWNCNPETSGVLHPSSLGAPSPSGVHLIRPSSFYYSPSFS